MIIVNIKKGLYISLKRTWSERMPEKSCRGNF